MKKLSFSQIKEAVRSKLAHLKNFRKSVVAETKYLKFPTKSETFSYLIIVLIMAVICATLFFIIDMLSHKIINRIICSFI